MSTDKPDACDVPDSTATAADRADLAAPGPTEIASLVMDCLRDLQGAANLTQGDVLVVGASSSEVIGKRIGTATSLEVGQAIVAAVLEFARSVGCEVVFQCCEHLNRSLVTTRALAKQRGWREVTAIPVPGAGGAVAACAYQALPDACLVEQVEVDAGIDIGDTLIGMHLRRVAVPVRGRIQQIGQAHVVMAKSRSPLIGGARAVYTAEEAAQRLQPGQGNL